MPLASFNAWKAYFNISPFGDIRADAHQGHISATIANVNRPKGHQGYSAADFMLFNKKPRKADLIEAKINKFMSRYH